MRDFGRYSNRWQTLSLAVLLSAGVAACSNGPSQPAAAPAQRQERPADDTPAPAATAPVAAEAAPETAPRAAAAPATTNLAKSAAESMSNAPVPAPANTAGQTGRIKAAGATLFRAPSTKARKVADLKARTTVTILERQYGSSQEEIILYHPMPAYASAARTGEPVLTLPAGAEVSIERFDRQQETYFVRFRHPEKGLLYGAVTASQLETLNYAYWYRIRTADGQEGWLPAKNIEL